MRGFTLIELVIACAVICCLMALTAVGCARVHASTVQRAKVAAHKLIEQATQLQNIS